MKYAYRWLYALGFLLCVCVLASITFLQAQWDSYRQARKQEATLAATLYKLRRFAQYHTQDDASLQTKYPQQYQLEMLKELFLIAHAQSLQVQAVEVVPQKQHHVTDAELIRIKANGQFAQFNRFLRALAQQARPYVMTDFSFKPNQGGDADVVMDIIALKMAVAWPINIDHPRALQSANPFCAAKQPPTTHHQNDLQLYPLQHIKMTGYLQQGQRQQAFVSLPNGKMFAVEQGAVIGVEHGLVQAVRAHEFIVVAAGHAIVMPFK